MDAFISKSFTGDEGIHRLLAYAKIQHVSTVPHITHCCFYCNSNYLLLHLNCSKMSYPGERVCVRKVKDVTNYRFPRGNPLPALLWKFCSHMVCNRVCLCHSGLLGLQSRQQISRIKQISLWRALIGLRISLQPFPADPMRCVGIGIWTHSLLSDNLWMFSTDTVSRNMMLSHTNVSIRFVYTRIPPWLTTMQQCRALRV